MTSCLFHNYLLTIYAAIMCKGLNTKLSLLINVRVATLKHSKQPLRTIFCLLVMNPLKYPYLSLMRLILQFPEISR